MSDVFDEVRLAASVFENSPEAIMITDREGRILRTNRAFTDITGYSLEEVRGKNPRLLQSGRHGPEFYAEIWRALEVTGAWRGEIRPTTVVSDEHVSSTVRPGGRAS